MKARDRGRRPAEIFALAGVKPGDRVIDFASFGNSDSTIPINVIGPRGRMGMYHLPCLEARTADPTRAFLARHRNVSHQIGKFDAPTDRCSFSSGRAPDPRSGLALRAEQG